MYFHRFLFLHGIYSSSSKLTTAGLIGLEVDTAKSRLAEAWFGVAAVVSPSSKSATAVAIVPEVDTDYRAAGTLTARLLL